MIRPKLFRFLGALVALTIAALPAFGQNGQPAKDAGKTEPPATGSFKGELKPATFPIKMTANQAYYFRVKAKNFQPRSQIRDKNLQQNYLDWHMIRVQNFMPGAPGQPFQQEYIQEFSYTPSQNGDYNICVSQAYAMNNGMAMDYTVEVFLAKTVFTTKGSLSTGDPFYSLRGNCHHKVHTLDLKGGQSYQIDVNGTYGTYLILEDGLGNIIQQGPTNSGGVNTARIAFQPSNTDKYRLIVTSNATSTTGDYGVTVSDAPFLINNPNFNGFFPPPPGNPVPPPVPRPPIKKFPNPRLPVPGLKGGVGGAQIQPAVEQLKGFRLQPAAVEVAPNQIVPDFNGRKD